MDIAATKQYQFVQANDCAAPQLAGGAQAPEGFKIAVKQSSDVSQCPSADAGTEWFCRLFEPLRISLHYFIDLAFDQLISKWCSCRGDMAAEGSLQAQTCQTLSVVQER